jgi:hypothetical protein
MDDTYLSRRHYDGVPAVKTDAVTWPDGIVREIVRAERGYSKSIHAAVRKGLVLELRVLVENGHGTSGPCFATTTESLSFATTTESLRVRTARRRRDPL